MSLLIGYRPCEWSMVILSCGIAFWLGPSKAFFPNEKGGLRGPSWYIHILFLLIPSTPVFLEIRREKRHYFAPCLLHSLLQIVGPSENKRKKLYTNVHDDVRAGSLYAAAGWVQETESTPISCQVLVVYRSLEAMKTRW
jgi:hypothetical protein